LNNKVIEQVLQSKFILFFLFYPMRKFVPEQDKTFWIFNEWV
jgi:hypothetical protein